MTMFRIQAISTVVLECMIEADSYEEARRRAYENGDDFEEISSEWHIDSIEESK